MININQTHFLKDN